jgi:SAM-dependent methyltransferase
MFVLLSLGSAIPMKSEAAAIGGGPPGSLDSLAAGSNAAKADDRRVHPSSRRLGRLASETLPQPPGRGPGPTDPAGAGRAVADGLVERILAAAGGSTFDFRVFACPDDPDAHLFDDWVARYRRKWALAQVLAPDTVMDLGAGYGYAAAAFLTARPGAAYLRVDLDDDDPDDAARTWAAGALAGFDVATSPLPVAGAPYDLAHVGGPIDGDALFAALELALGHARHLVVDDYHVRSRFLAANEFLHQHRDELRAWWAVPGLGGELVVAVADDVVAGPADGRGSAPTSGALRHLYDEHYFLQDCDGHEGYKRDNGGRLRDPRLAAVASIGELRGPRRVLDLGCGRGELTAHFARHGADVTAVDYSADAVELARRALADTPQLQSRVQFVVGDVNTVPIDGPFDLAVASDLVEHLTPAELDALYARVADLLAPAGVLVIHTFPNRWFYEREYPRRRAQAQALGAYLPPEPRSRYERLMHINEQSPDDLRQQLG